MRRIVLEMNEEDYEIIQEVFSSFQSTYHNAGFQVSITKNYSGNMAAKILMHIAMEYRERSLSEGLVKTAKAGKMRRLPCDVRHGYAQCCRNADLTT